jgi:hypothetical protein
MQKAEIIIASISIVVLGLDLMPFQGASFMAIQALMILSMFYFALSFGLLNGIKLKAIFKKESYRNIGSLGIVAAAGTGYFLATTIIGILFKFQNYPGATYILTVGLVGLLVFTIIAAIKYAKNKYKGFFRILIRVIIIGGFGLFLVLIPKTAIVDFKYRNHPKYYNKIKNVYPNSDDKSLLNTLTIKRQETNDHKKIYGA